MLDAHDWDSALRSAPKGEACTEKYALGGQGVCIKERASLRLVHLILRSAHAPTTGVHLPGACNLETHL